MSDDLFFEIRYQLAAIRLAVTLPTRVHAPKAKAAPPKTVYGWFKRSWTDAEFRAMIVERFPSIDDAFDSVEAYEGLEKDEKAIVRELFEAQNDGASDDETSS